MSHKQYVQCLLLPKKTLIIMLVVVYVVVPLLFHMQFCVLCYISPISLNSAEQASSCHSEAESSVIESCLSECTIIFVF